MVFIDMSGDTMGLLIDWLYADFKDDLSWQQYADLLQVAHKYDIAELQLQCETALGVLISCENWCHLMDLTLQCCFGFLQQVTLTVLTRCADLLWHTAFA